MQGAQLREELEAFPARARVARVVEVHEDGGELVGLEGGHDLGGGGRGLGREALALEEEAQRLQHVGLVVGDEDAGRGRGG
jgi:hypothetical protein